MEVSQHWRMRNQRYGLTGSSCSTCGTPSFTAQAVCQKCTHSADIYNFDRKTVRRLPTVQVPAQR